MSARRFRLILAGIVLAGLAVRLAYALALVKSAPLLGDALEFHLQANLLADGRGFIQPYTWALQHVARPTADKPPVYPLLEAAFSLLGGRSWQWHQLVGCLAGTATVAVVGMVGRRIGGPRVGLLAAALAALYPLMIASDGSLRSESVYALGVALVLWAAVAYRERPSARRAALLGVLIGLAALTRSEALLLLVLLVAPLAGWRRTGIAVLASLVLLTPWLVRCWVVFGHPVAISTNVGGLLAGANCYPAYHGALLGQWTLSCFNPKTRTNEADESDLLRAQGVDYALDHAGRLPVVVAARVGRSLELFRPGQGAHLEAFFEHRNLRVEQAGVLMFYVLSVLGVCGVVVLRRRDGPWWILVAPFVLVVVVAATSYGITRLRAAAEPGLTVLAAVGVDAGLAGFRRRRATSRPPG